MSTAHEKASPSAEVIHELPVSTRRGHGVVVALGFLAVLLLVGAGVSIFAGAPPEIAVWKWPMAAVGAIALAGAIIRHRARRRTLTIVRTGDQHHLVIESEQVRLEFPLGLSGDQMKTSMRGVPIYEVWLKLVDTYRRYGIFLSETRGAIHGAQHGWLTGIDKAVACDRFESGRVGMLAELRAAVESINARYR